MAIKNNDWTWCNLALIAYLGDFGLGDIGPISDFLNTLKSPHQIQSSIFNHLLKVFKKSEMGPEL